jgi:hypothetical protein
MVFGGLSVPMNLARFAALAVFFLAVSPSLFSIAGPTEDANAAYKDNALAQKNLAAMHAQGRDDAKSGAEAITSPPMPANTNIDRGTDFEVGRVTLRMPDGAWESIGTSRRGLPYTGDRSGEIPFVTRHLLLRDSAGKFRAAFVVSASWGVGTVHMTWTQLAGRGRTCTSSITRGAMSTAEIV